MHTKPVILLVYRDDSEHDQFRQGLSHFLENDLGFTVLAYNSADSLCKDCYSLAMAKHGVAVAILFVEDEGGGWESSIEEILSAYPSIPSFFMPRDWKSGYQAKVPIIYFNDPEDSKTFENLKSSWRPPKDWIGAESARERCLYYEHLAESYARNYLDDDSERLLCPSDRNHQVVAQALRVKQYRGEMIAEEFEQSLDWTGLDLKFVETEKYDACVKKLKSLDRRGIEAIMNRILNSSELGVHEKSIYGYAYDPLTKEVYQTNKMGFHDSAALMLGFRLESIEQYQHRREGKKIPLVSGHPCRRRLIKALIYTSIPGLEVPLMAYIREGMDTTVAEMDEFIRHIYRERKYIPVDMERKESFVICPEG